jgi:hypothetical protein
LQASERANHDDTCAQSLRHQCTQSLFIRNLTQRFALHTEMTAKSQTQKKINQTIQTNKQTNKQTE